MALKFIGAAVFCTILFTAHASADEIKVSSAEEIRAAAARAKPGDEIVIADANWADQAIEFTAAGTESQPITLRGQTPGKVVLTGKSSLAIDGEYCVVSGLSFKDNNADGDGIAIRGAHNRLTETSITGGNYKFLVHLFGERNRVDHCYLAEKANDGPTMQIEVEQQRANYHQVDHNHFGHRPPLGRNGGESMRVGYSGQSQWNSRATVEFNLFEQCDGEIEIISSKSCENIYRCNTFLDSAGFLTLRHGHRCVVDSNFFLCKHKAGSGGVRVINEGHTITNNYFEGADKGCFWITSGIKDGPLTGYTRAKDCLIAFNTMVDYAGPGVELAAGLGTANRTLVPEDVTIANNIFSPGEKGTLIKGEEGKYSWMGNFVLGNAAKADDRIRAAGEVELVRTPDGLLKPSKAVAGAGSFPNVKTDIFGRPRGEQSEVGCEISSDAKPTNRPLTANDVGPGWMKRDASGR